MSLLSALPPDLLLDICARYLPVRDVAALLNTNRHLYRFSTESYFWETLVRHKVAPIQAVSESPAQWSDRAKTSLGVPSAYTLFRLFHSFTRPLEGYWMMLGNPRGGLYSIQLMNSCGYHLSCRYGGDGGSALIGYNGGNCLAAVYRGKADATLLEVHVDDDKIVMRGNDNVMHMFCGLPTMASSLSRCPHMHSVVGLFTACYGPHGPEVIATSIGKVNSCIRNTNEEITELCGPLVLYGLKVTGDANVPSGELSFIVNCGKHFDVVTEIHSVGPHSQLTLFDFNRQISTITLENRHSKIVTWMKGKGQINIFPGLWRPQWVDMEFLIYDQAFSSSSNDRNLSFSVLFPDMSYILDFTKGTPA